MNHFLVRLGSRLSAEDGATATEYSIVVGFIAIGIVAGVGLLGLALSGYFNDLVSGIKAALALP